MQHPQLKAFRICFFYVHFLYQLVESYAQTGLDLLPEVMMVHVPFENIGPLQAF